MDGKLMRSANEATAATIARPVATAGEVFADGSMIELIGGGRGENPMLMLWNGKDETIGAHIEHNGVKYEPARLPANLLREWTLPTQSGPYGTTGKLLAEICEMVRNFGGLSEEPASLVGRFILCSWLVEGIQVAPALVLVGPDTPQGSHLVGLLHCLCRHGLRMTGLTPAGMRSLPSGAGFTFLISQSTISRPLELLLNDASRRDQKIPHHGNLLDLFGAQVIRADSISFGEAFNLRSITIPMISGGTQPPSLDPEPQYRITAEFQAKLLGFRRANLSAARSLHFDSSKFAPSMSGLAHCLAAATPDDPELQAGVFELLREKDMEIRDGKWVELNTVAVESLLVAYHDSPGMAVYVGDLAKTAQEILNRRGEESSVDAGAVGKQLKILGFRTEPRDAKGVKIRLTDDVYRRAREIAREYGIPYEEDAALQGQAGIGL